METLYVDSETCATKIIRECLLWCTVSRKVSCFHLTPRCNVEKFTVYFSFSCTYCAIFHQLLLDFMKIQTSLSSQRWKNDEIWRYSIELINIWHNLYRSKIMYLDVCGKYVATVFHKQRAQRDTRDERQKDSVVAFCWRLHSRLLGRINHLLFRLNQSNCPNNKVTSSLRAANLIETLSILIITAAAREVL